MFRCVDATNLLARYHEALRFAEACRSLSALAGRCTRSELTALMAATESNAVSTRVPDSCLCMFLLLNSMGKGEEHPVPRHGHGTTVVAISELAGTALIFTQSIRKCCASVFGPAAGWLLPAGASHHARSVAISSERRE